jgi:sugar-specific transcriptional regulator TrmB
MIVENDFLAKLKDFGLNSYEAKLWTALLSRGISTAGELSDIANVPRSRTYDVLESLEKKGFIIMKIGKPIKYLAVEPAEVLARVQSSITKDAEQRVGMMEELKESSVLKELTLLHTQGIEMVNPSDYSGSFKGRDSIYDHLDTMFKTAEKSITIVTTESGLMRKIPYFKKALEKASARGVKVKIAAKLDNVSKDDPLFKEIPFAEIKNANITSRFIVVDGQEVLFMLLDDAEVHQSYDTGIWINTPFFAAALDQLFELAWNEMEIVVKQ